MGGLRKGWTQKEDRIIIEGLAKSEVPTTDGRIMELLPQLPGRTKNGIRNRISHLGVNRQVTSANSPLVVEGKDLKQIKRDELFRAAMLRAHPNLAKGNHRG